MNLDDQPEWIHARQAERRAAFERRQHEARREAARRQHRRLLAQYRGVPVPPLPTVEEDEDRIAMLTRLREARSEPAASTAAELVWRLITGAGDAPGLSIIEASMSEMEKIQYFETLRLTNTDAAMRFANAAGIFFVETQIIYRTLDNPRAKLYRTSPMTQAIMTALSDGELLSLDYVEYLARQSGKIDPTGNSIEVLIENTAEPPWAHRYEVYKNVNSLIIGVKSARMIR